MTVQHTARPAVMSPATNDTQNQSQLCQFCLTVSPRHLPVHY